MRIRRRFPHAIAAACFALLAHSAFADTFIVTTEQDSVNAGDGVTSLREAINAAIALGGTNTVTFDAAVFSAAAPKTIVLGSALPDLPNNLTISGVGPKAVTISGQGTANPFRIFRILTGRTVTISAVTISNGAVLGANGAEGVAGTPPTSGTSALGGGIHNSGTLTLTSCVLSGHSVQGGAGGVGGRDLGQNGATGGSGRGGAVYSDGTALTVVGCTFLFNFATGGNGGGGSNADLGAIGNGAQGFTGSGGAISIATTSGHAITNSTFFGNVAAGGTGGDGGATSNPNNNIGTGGNGGNAQGGAVQGTQFTVTSSTFAGGAVNPGLGGYSVSGNFDMRAPEGVPRGGGLFANPPFITIGNSLVAKNTSTSPVTGAVTARDVSGPFTSQNFNLIGAVDNAGGFTGASDQTGTAAAPLDPKLDASGPGDHGGLTPTVRIVRGSPAADKGKDIGPTGVDQRGLTRPVNLPDGTFPNASGGDGSDIGAFESQTAPNTKPIAFAGQITGTAGVALSGQQLLGMDGDNDTLTFSLAAGSTMPAGLTLNANGTVTGTSSTPVQATLSFKVNDGIEDSDTVTFELKIAEPGSLVVNVTTDNSTDYDSLTSLREAIAFAQGDGANTPVTFDAAVFATAKTIALGSPITLPGDVTIHGAAAGVTVSGGGATRLFVVNGGPANFQNLTLANGRADSSGAGAVTVGFGSTATLTGCTLHNNGGNSIRGGAIKNTGGTVTLSNCTLTGNFATGSGSNGGAIFQQNSGTLTVVNCTITGNTATTGGGIAADSGTVSLGNSIVSGNAGTGPDLAAVVDSLGYNFIGDATGAVINGDTTGNQIGVAPGLDPVGLASNGGPTQTIALLPGGAAIDAGKAFGGATTDARGVARPSDIALANNAPGGDGSDVGAYEQAAGVPEIAVEFPAGTDLLDGGATIDLGPADVFTTSDLVFTIFNKGAADLSMANNPKVVVSGTDAALFTVTAQPASPLGTGASTTFIVRFAPTSLGIKSAALTIPNNDTDEGPFNIALTANVVETITVPPTITSPASGGNVFPMASVTFTLPENALANSVKLTFDNGTAFESVLGGANETAGSHTVVIDTAAAAMPLGDYSLTLSYQDAAGHPAASTTNTNIHLRPLNPVSATIITKGMAAPGAGTNGLPADAVIASFNAPATDDDGDLAFIAKWTSNNGKLKGTGLFLNATCLAIVGGNASVVGGAGATWKSFTDPVVSAGHAACIAKLSTGKTAIVCNLTGAALEKIARSGEAAAGASVGGATFKSFKAVTVQTNRVAFLAQLTAGTGTPKVAGANDIGVWYYEPNNPLFVMREGDAVAGKTIKTLVAFLPGSGSPGQGRGALVNSTINSDPVVTALARFTDKTQGVITQNIDDGPPSLGLSLSSNAATGVDNGATFASYGPPARNSDETTAFRATLTIGAGVTKADASGIFTGPDGNGKFETLVRIGINATQAGAGAKFSLLKDPVLSEDGAIAFPATVKGGAVKGAAMQTLWWKPAGGNLTLLAQGGQRASNDLPAGAQWKAFTSLAIAGGGRGPIFAATLVPNKGGVTAKSASGVWACDFTGAPRLLFRTGDFMAGKTLKSFKLLNATVGSLGVTRSFNDAAQVVWLATFTDTTQAIVTTEVP